MAVQPFWPRPVGWSIFKKGPTFPMGIKQSRIGTTAAGEPGQGADRQMPEVNVPTLQEAIAVTWLISVEANGQEDVHLLEGDFGPFEGRG
ncbi:MAG: hypothetical protein CM15mP120_23010 [Pseudomonadota bacterium]|nr:MAG: hypothetical protein CM15mP120_23010 [Pseudomonadota bacterium]